MAKSFLCIGAGPGIGLATAIQFAREGYRPVIVARNRGKLEQLASEIASSTGRIAEIVEADAGEQKQIIELAKRFPDIDVLHYNAAIVHGQTLGQADYHDIYDDIQTGITGALYALKAFSPAMLTKQAGTILLTGGILALHPIPEYLVLGVAKAAIRNMTEALFHDFAEKNVHIANITVSAAVAPGSHEAAEVANMFWDIHSQPKNKWTWNEEYVK